MQIQLSKLIFFLSTHRNISLKFYFTILAGFANLRFLGQTALQDFLNYLELSYRSLYELVLNGIIPSSIISAVACTWAAFFCGDLLSVQTTVTTGKVVVLEMKR